MKRYPVSVRPKADEEVLDLAAYIAEHTQSDEAAHAFIRAFESMTLRIAESPKRWALSRHRPRGDKTLRHRSIDGFPNHLIFYRFDGKEVVIVRVLHGARDLPTQVDTNVDESTG